MALSQTYKQRSLVYMQMWSGYMSVIFILYTVVGIHVKSSYRPFVFFFTYNTKCLPNEQMPIRFIDLTQIHILRYMFMLLHDKISRPINKVHLNLRLKNLCLQLLIIYQSIPKFFLQYTLKIRQTIKDENPVMPKNKTPG